MLNKIHTKLAHIKVFYGFGLQKRLWVVVSRVPELCARSIENCLLVHQIYPYIIIINCTSLTGCMAQTSI